MNIGGQGKMWFGLTSNSRIGTIASNNLSGGILRNFN
jgi:hypothetical protein